MLPNKEIDSFWRFTISSVDRIVLCMDGLGEEDLNWRPLDNANSLYILATHTMENVEENILGNLCGQKISRQRENEFKVVGGSIEPVQQKWREIQERITSALAQLSTAELDREHEHPRHGKITGRDILIVVARHAAEHMGQTELTRDLLFKTRGREIPQRNF
jgi:uncharacterized damage-inducible protein DinB